MQLGTWETRLFSQKLLLNKPAGVYSIGPFAGFPLPCLETSPSPAGRSFLRSFLT